MKSKILFLISVLLCSFSILIGENIIPPNGFPSILNFTSKETHMGNRNYDVCVDYDGNLYFANINGFLAYNGTQWTQLYSPNFERGSMVFTDQKGNIWAGGYNTIGKIVIDSLGDLKYKSLTIPSQYNISVGEVADAMVNGDTIYFLGDNAIIEVIDEQITQITTLTENIYSTLPLYSKFYVQMDNNAFYLLDKGKLIPTTSLKLPQGVLCKSSLTLSNGKTLLGTNKGLFVLEDSTNAFPTIVKQLEDVNIRCIIELPNSYLSAVSNNGIYQLRPDLSVMRHISERNGLIGNNISWANVTPNGTLWCTSENGISAIDITSPITRYGKMEGLHGDIVDMCNCGKDLYVATFDGLFIYNPQSYSFDMLPNMDKSCWKLYDDKSQLIAYTSTGVYRVMGKNVQLLDSRPALVGCNSPDGDYWCGGYDGVYCIPSNKKKKKDFAIPISRTSQIVFYKEHVFFETVYGELYFADKDGSNLQAMNESYGLESLRNNHIQKIGETLFILNAHGVFCWNDKEMKIEKNNFFKASDQHNQNFIPYKMSIAPNGNIATIGIEGRAILIFNDSGKLLLELSRSLLPLFSKEEQATLTYFENDMLMWVAIGNSLYRVELTNDIDEQVPYPEIRIHNIRVNQVRFGGYRTIDKAHNAIFCEKLFLSSNENNFHVSYGTNNFGSAFPTKYSYRIVGFDEKWSNWNKETSTSLYRLPAGNYRFEVRARDVYNRISNTASFEFHIDQILFLRWYMIVLYVILFIYLFKIIYNLRIKAFKRNQVALEDLIKKRTQKIKNQRDEIEIKSQLLQKTMEDLKNSQAVIVQQERMAMVGKLTQGLIDRVLNPVNYIINFSSVTSKFIKEFNEVLEDEKDNISEDGLADLEDIGGMMDSNLQKIMTHGQSISKTLRVMEELLSDDGGTITKLELNELLSIVIEYFKSQNKEDLKRYAIDVILTSTPNNIYINGNGETLNKMCISMLKNSLYAVCKKREREQFEPKILVTILEREKKVEIQFSDNGIGMEASILNKIYDPYFTTKPSADAAGIGLYFTREVVLKHQGTISVETHPNEGTKFIIIFPKFKPKNLS